MQKIMAFFLGLFILTSFVPTALAQGGKTMIIKDHTGSGILRISSFSQTDKKMKLMMEKDDQTIYYNLRSGQAYEDFPLVMGNGQYKVTILENTTGNRYKVVLSEVVDVVLHDQYQPFLQSIQLIKWHEDTTPIKKARELTFSLKENRDKVKVLYDYVAKTIAYDYNKINNVSTDYLPDIEAIYSSKQGICYDYASLLAAMLRSVGIPAKLVKGYSENAVGYHAWNEVFIDNQWVIIDATYDAQLFAKNQNVDMFKVAGQYSKVNEH